MSILSQQVKDKWLLGQQTHFEHDSIIQGTWGNTDSIFRGCHIGCSANVLGVDHVGNYKELSLVTGVPIYLFMLSQEIFEGMLSKEAKQFSLDFISNLPVGINLTTLIPLISIVRLKYLYDIQITSSNKYFKFDEVMNCVDNLIKILADIEYESKVVDIKESILIYLHEAKELQNWFSYRELTSSNSAQLELNSIICALNSLILTIDRSSHAANNIVQSEVDLFELNERNQFLSSDVSVDHIIHSKQNAWLKESKRLIEVFKGAIS